MYRWYPALGFNFPYRFPMYWPPMPYFGFRPRFGRFGKGRGRGWRRFGWW